MMAETIQRNGMWHMMLAEKDLVEQAGLNKADFEQDFGHFKYKKGRVVLSHIYDQHLVVSMEGGEDDALKQLIDGFSTVVGYKPFCKYLLQSSRDKSLILPTYEWDKVNPSERFEELSKKSNISDLVRV